MNPNITKRATNASIVLLTRSYWQKMGSLTKISYTCEEGCICESHEPPHSIPVDLAKRCMVTKVALRETGNGKAVGSVNRMVSGKDYCRKLFVNIRYLSIRLIWTPACSKIIGNCKFDYSSAAIVERERVAAPLSSRILLLDN